MRLQPLFGHPACLVTQLGVHVQEQVVDLLAPLNIHPRHFGMLSLLAEQDGQTQHELCEALSIHRNVMVGLVDELEQRGLVERARHPADRRAYAVRLLPAGRQLREEAEALLNDFEGKLLGALGDEEAAVFTELLQRVSALAGLDLEVHPGLKSADGRLIAAG